MSSVEQLRPSPGASFARVARACIAGASDTSAGARLRALAGDDGWLCDARPLVFDADSCSFENSALENTEDFWRVIRANALDRIDGAFALAWRTPSNGIALARDAIGHRTLYYAEHAGALFFASSLYALCRALPQRPELDARSIALYLSCAYVPGRGTLLQGICELLPGELLTWEPGGRLKVRQYWDLPAEPAAFRSEADLQLSLRASLEQQIARFLPSAGPVAASLSGGIDSSLVVALAKRLHGAPVHTFSLSFGPEYANELEFSSLVAAHCETEHHIVELTPEVVLAHLDDTMACLDKPNGDPLTVPNALLFRTMAERAKVALNGEGGDPCFGGPKNVPMLLAELYGDGEAERERSYFRAHAKCFDELAELLRPELLARAATPPLEAELTPWFSDARYRDFVSRLFAINVRWKGGHHILPKIAALSAPFGVRARSPLFAKSLVEAAFAIPPQLKLHGSVEKYLLKRAVQDTLPERIVLRPKSGMMVPVEGWFQPRGPLYRHARERVLDGLARHELFQRARLEELVAGRSGGLRPRRGVKLWLLITLESHLRALRD